MSDIQDEIDAISKPGLPRVTPWMIEEEIEHEFYFTAADGALSAGQGDYIPESLDLLTICVLVLKNGFTTTGTSAVVSRENFNADIGRKVARDKALVDVWQVLGFRLLEERHASEAAAARQENNKAYLEELKGDNE